MKKELKHKYLPIDYKQEIYHKIHNLKQKELSVDEYTEPPLTISWWKDN